jgi:hypothetical protein
MSDVVSRAEFEALKDQLAGVVAFIETSTTQGNALKAERATLARKQRNARVNALPVAEYVAFAEGLRPFDRPSLHTPPARAIELARECGSDRALLGRLLAVVPDGTAGEIALAIMTPAKRTRLLVAPKREVTLIGTRLTEAQAAEADRVGLPLEMRRVQDALEEQPFTPALEVEGRGWDVVLPSAAVNLWRELDRSFDLVTERGVITATELSENESREIDRNAWREAGGGRNVPTTGSTLGALS